MAETTVIREFLAKLGFKVDDASYAKFTKGLGEATKRAAEMSAVVEGLAVTVQAVVVKVADTLDELYWASLRTRSAALNIKAYDYAIGQLGGTARGARAALESVAQFLSTNPGAERWLAGIGVRTRDANGQVRDTERVMEDLGKRLATMPQYLAVRYAQMLGIDYNTLLAMERGAAGYAEQYRNFARSIGVDLGGSAAASNRFMTSVRLLRAEVGLLVTKIGAELITRWGPKLQEFLVWLGQHATQVADRIRVWTERIARLGAAIFNFAMRALSFLERLDRATDGWSTALIGLVAVLWPLLSGLLPLLFTQAGAITVGIVALVAALGLLYADFEKWRAGGKSLIDWGPWAAQASQLVSDVRDLVSALTDLGKSLSVTMGPAMTLLLHSILTLLDLDVRAVGHLARAMDALLNRRWGEAAREAGGWLADTAKAFAVAAATPAAVGGAAAGGISRGAQGATSAPAAKFGVVQKMLQALGWTPAQAAGIAANLQAESGFATNRYGDNGQAYGIAQWHGDRQAEFRKLFGHDIRSSTLAEQIAFVDYELRKGRERAAGQRLARARTAGEAGAIVSLFYERPGGAGEAAKRSALAEAGMRGAALGETNTRNIRVDAHTVIHIDGSKDPHATGRAVAGEMGRFWGDTLRNSTGAVR